MTSAPLALLLRLAVCGVEFLSYNTVYAVEGVSPFKVMVPVALLQFVGCVNDVVVITGVGLTTTVRLPGAEGQLPVTAVATTLYAPFAAMVTLVMLGFCETLLNALGPFHAQVIVPGEVVEAVRSKVLSVQTGPLLFGTGVAGV
jgi:hypothetical protein